MALTKERVEEVVHRLAGIRLLLSDIKEEEIDELIRIGNYEGTVGPLMDPTRWRDEDLFEKTDRAQEVLRAIKELKRRLEHETTKT